MGQFDHIERMITLSVITLSGFHCNWHSLLYNSQLRNYLMLSIRKCYCYKVNFTDGSLEPGQFDHIN
jgi:hypothetical protein